MLTDTLDSESYSNFRIPMPKGLNSTVYFLKYLEDAVGTLSEVSEADGHKIAIIGGISVGIPDEIATKLLPNIGKRVGLLKTDTDFRIKISDGIHARGE